MAHAHAYAKLKRSSPLAPSMTPGCYTPGDTDLSIPAIPPGARWRASESDEHVFRPDTQKRIKVIYESPAVREKCTNAALRINLGREVSDVKGTLLATKGVCTNSGIKKMLDERVKFGAQVRKALSCLLMRGAVHNAQHGSGTLKIAVVGCHCKRQPHHSACMSRNRVQTRY